MKCEACENGAHWDCGMQSWCDCDDEGDGDLDAAMFPEFDPYDVDPYEGEFTCSCGKMTRRAVDEGGSKAKG